MDVVTAGEVTVGCTRCVRFVAHFEWVRWVWVCALHMTFRDRPEKFSVYLNRMGALVLGSVTYKAFIISSYPSHYSSYMSHTCSCCIPMQSTHTIFH